MSAADPIREAVAPGRLVIGPTEAFLGGTFPYGGTEVARCSDGRFTPLGEPFVCQSEGLGAPIEIGEPTTEGVFSCLLWGTDDDVFEELFPGHFSEGDTSQHAVWSLPSTNLPGARAYSRGLVVAYVPDDPRHVNGAMLYHAIPFWTQGTAYEFNRANRQAVPVTFYCMYDGSDRVASIGRISDLEV